MLGTSREAYTTTTPSTLGLSLIHIFETGSLLVVSGSLPPGIGVDNLTQLVKSAQRHGLRCIIDRDVYKRQG